MKKVLEKSNQKKGIFKYSKLKNSQVRNLISDLSSYFGVDNLGILEKYSFYKNNSDKVYIFNGDFSDIDPLRINSLGLYFGTFHGDRFRLSIEGSKFIKPKQNYIKLTDSSFNSYITAENLFEDEVEIVSKTGNCPFLIVRYNDESLGSISIKELDDSRNIILTYMPKSRKLDYNKVF